MSDKSYCWADLPLSLARASHGHVAPRPDQLVARCGGPSLCKACQDELAFFETYTKRERADHVERYLKAECDSRTAEIARLRADVERMRIELIKAAGEFSHIRLNISSVVEVDRTCVDAYKDITAALRGSNREDGT